MKSFAFAIEPGAQPRLAAGLLLLHATIAALPWVTRCTPLLALGLSTLAIIGLACNLGRVPGPHCRLQAVAADGSGWRIRLAGETVWRPASLGRESRATAGGVRLELCAGGRRCGWLLPRSAAPVAEFRRLRVRIHLS